MEFWSSWIPFFLMRLTRHLHWPEMTCAQEASGSSNQPQASCAPNLNAAHKRPRDYAATVSVTGTANASAATAAVATPSSPRVCRLLILPPAGASLLADLRALFTMLAARIQRLYAGHGMRHGAHWLTLSAFAHSDSPWRWHMLQYTASSGGLRWLVISYEYLVDWRFRAFPPRPLDLLLRLWLLWYWAFPCLCFRLARITILVHTALLARFFIFIFIFIFIYFVFHFSLLGSAIAHYLSFSFALHVDWVGVFANPSRWMRCAREIRD